jgi:hypothetical protein
MGMTFTVSPHTPEFVWREAGWNDATAGKPKRLEEAREAGHAHDYLVGYRRGVEARKNDAA